MGISTHSTPSKLFIFSAHRHNRDLGTNMANHEFQEAFFTEKGIPFVTVRGQYKGNVEQAFLMNAKDVPEEAILFYSRHWHQDEYMVLDNHKHGTYIASMVNCATQEQRQIGFFRSMPKAEVERLGLDYTYRKDVDTYWVVWPTDTTMLDAFEAEKDNFLAQRQLAPTQ